MSFKYIDPGYGVICGQKTGVFKSNVFNPRNGVAFYSYGRSMINLADTLGNVFMTDLYVKFDIFLPETAPETGDAMASVHSGYRFKLLKITQYEAGFLLDVLGEEDNDFGDTFEERVDGAATNLKAGRVNTIWLHAVSGNYESNITVIVNNERVVNDVSTPSQCLGTLIGFDINAEVPVSNVIISDEEIDLNETVVEVGHSSVETTMTENDGAYSSAMIGAHVLQTLDTTNLYGLFGSDSKVTGLAAIAAPAYTTGDEINKIKCRMVDGETVTDYWIPDPEFPEDADLYLEQYSEEEIAALENKVPSQGKQLSIASDTTFASLNGLKVGWVTA